MMFSGKILLAVTWVLFGLSSAAPNIFGDKDPRQTVKTRELRGSMTFHSNILVNGYSASLPLPIGSGALPHYSLLSASQNYPPQLSSRLVHSAYEFSGPPVPAAPTAAPTVSPGGNLIYVSRTTLTGITQASFSADAELAFRTATATTLSLEVDAIQIISITEISQSIVVEWNAVVVLVPNDHPANPPPKIANGMTVVMKTAVHTGVFWTTLSASMISITHSPTANIYADVTEIVVKYVSYSVDTQTPQPTTAPSHSLSGNLIFISRTTLIGITKVSFSVDAELAFRKTTAALLFLSVDAIQIISITEVSQSVVIEWNAVIVLAPVDLPDKIVNQTAVIMKKSTVSGQFLTSLSVTMISITHSETTNVYKDVTGVDDEFVSYSVGTPNPTRSPTKLTAESWLNSKKNIGPIVGASIGAFILILLICLCLTCICCPFWK